MDHDEQAAAAARWRDSHDLIRVHGARVNNLKDVSVELPKRRLTVFTGVSGSGKSSLVFGTIAAESQRMINETYSAFVQGFMPTLARPDVDVLDGLTTAILVDQERMGGEPPLHGRHRHRRQRDAADPLQPARQAAHRLARGVLLQRRLGARERRDHGREAATRRRRRRRRFSRTGGMCARCEGRGAINDIDLTQLYDETQVAQRGRDHDPRLQHGGLVRAHLPRLRLLRPGQADRQVQQERAARPPLQGGDQDQGRRDQPDLPGPDPADAEVDALQGRRRAAAAHPRLRGAGRDVHDLPRLRRHPAQRGGPLVEDRRDQHRRRLRDADQRPGRVGPRPRRAVGGAAARRRSGR